MITISINAQESIEQLIGQGYTIDRNTKEVRIFKNNNSSSL